MTLPKRVPERFYRGDQVQWLETWPDYRPGAWTLTIAFAHASDQQTFTATDHGDGSHLVTIDAAASAVFTPDTYRYQVRVSDGGSVAKTVKQGAIVVVQSLFDQDSGWDSRSHAERVLEALDAMLEGKASTDQASFTVAGKQLTRYSFDELLELRKYYRRELEAERAQERIDAGLADPNVTHIKFVRPQ